MNIRQLQEADYETIIAAIDDWFDGRQMSHLLPRIFFIHFRPTSFAIEEDDGVVGFLAGFISQSYPRRHSSQSPQTWFWTPALLNIFRDRSTTWLHNGSLHYFACEQRINRVSHSSGLSR
jgi:hypothetical protein